MFCPLCRSEYREGFYRCADCGVPLVFTLPQEPSSNTAEKSSGEMEAAVLCQEDDPAILTAILSALSEARIPYYDYPIQNAKGHFSTPFPGGLSLGRGYEIRVLKSDLGPAQRILAKILDREDELPPMDIEVSNLSEQPEVEVKDIPED